MASRTYQNFDLLLEAAEGDSFRARVTTSPLGESPARLSPAVRRDPAGEPAAQARPRAQRHPSSRFRPAEPGVDGSGWAVVRECVLRGHHVDLAAVAGLRPRPRRRAAAAAAADRRTVDRRPALGAAVRPARQQLHRPVRTDPGGPLPRSPATAAAADRRRCADPRRHLLPHRPARARRRGRVATGAGRPRRQGRPGHREDRPATGTDDPGAVGLATAERRPHPALHRPRRLRRPHPGRRRLLPGPVRAQHQGQPHRPRPLPTRPRPATAGPAQRLPVRPRRQHRPVQRNGARPGPTGLHRRRRHAAPHLRRRRHRVRRQVLRRWPTASPSTRPPPARAKPSSPNTPPNGPPPYCSYAPPTAAYSTTSSPNPR